MNDQNQPAERSLAESFIETLTILGMVADGCFDSLPETAKETLAKSVAKAHDHFARGHIRQGGAKRRMPGKLTLGQIASRLAISKRSVQSYMKRGELPFYRFGRNVWFDAAEVDKAWQAMLKPAKEVPPCDAGEAR